MRRLKGFFLDTPGNPFFSEIFSPRACGLLEGVLDLDPRIVTPGNIVEMQSSLEAAEVLIGTWGFPVELADQLAQLPRLRIFLYAGGSVKAFARPFLERGIPVINGRQVNAKAVAEFFLAQIILSNKGHFRKTRMCRFPETAHQTVAYTGPGNHGETVALLGYGLIARELRSLLRMLPLRVIVVDPTLDRSVQPDEAIELVSMEEAFSEASIISNHLPDLER